MSVISTSGWGRRAVAVLAVVGVLTVGSGSAAHSHDVEHTPTDGFDAPAWLYEELLMGQRTTVDGRQVHSFGVVVVGPTFGVNRGGLSASWDECVWIGWGECLKRIQTTYFFDWLTFRHAPDGSIHDASAVGRLWVTPYTRMGPSGPWERGADEIVDTTWSGTGHYGNGELVLDLGSDIDVNARLVFEPL